MTQSRLAQAMMMCAVSPADVWALAAEAEINPLIGQYLNRVSDLLFVMARDANDGGRGDVLWVPGGADA